MGLFLTLLKANPPDKLALLYANTAIFPMAHKKKKLKFLVCGLRCSSIQSRGVGLLISVPVPADGYIFHIEYSQKEGLEACFCTLTGLGNESFPCQGVQLQEVMGELSLLGWCVLSSQGLGMALRPAPSSKGVL